MLCPSVFSLSLLHYSIIGSPSGYTPSRPSKRQVVKEQVSLVEEPEVWYVVGDSIKETRLRINDLEPSKNYKVRLRAKSTEGYSAFTDKSPTFKTNRRL